MARPDHALIVIDMQSDFRPGGALAAPGGNRIVGGINILTDEAAATETMRAAGIRVA